MEIARRGVALILSGPSGVGKSTLKNALVGGEFAFEFSVSCTTRSPRGGEVDGVDYHFVDHELFERHLAAEEFLEHANVHGNFYGTLRSEVEARVMAGRDLLLDIDVQGAQQIKKLASSEPWGAFMTYVFVGPPSMAELEKRLRARNTDSDAVIARRLDGARDEMACWRDYDFLIVNDDMQQAIAELQGLVRAERVRPMRLLTENPW